LHWAAIGCDGLDSTVNAKLASGVVEVEAASKEAIDQIVKPLVDSALNAFGKGLIGAAEVVAYR